MTDIIQSPMKSLIIRTRSYPEPPEGCPITTMIARGRKGEAREQQLSTAEQIAAGVKRRKVSGIYKVRP
jgi:hypothetical protein